MTDPTDFPEWFKAGISAEDFAKHTPDLTVEDARKHIADWRTNQAEQLKALLAEGVEIRKQTHFVAVSQGLPPVRVPGLDSELMSLEDAARAIKMLEEAPTGRSYSYKLRRVGGEPLTTEDIRRLTPRRPAPNPYPAGTRYGLARRSNLDEG